MKQKLIFLISFLLFTACSDSSSSRSRSPTASPYCNEIYVGELSGPLLVFSRTDTGDVAPKRTITSVTDIQGIAVDTVNGEIWTTQNSGHSITVYSRSANGAATPLRTIVGASTTLNGPAGIAVDTTNNLVYVANGGAHSVLVFSRTANGDTAPLRSISGAFTTFNLPWDVALDLTNSEIIIANFGNGSVDSFPSSASGDVSPSRTLTGAGAFGSPLTVIVDPTNNEIIATDPNDILRIFPRTANATAAYTRQLTGAATTLSTPGFAAVDYIHDELITPQSASGQILTFDRTAADNTAPIRTISGAATLLVSPKSVAVTPCN